LWRVGFLKLFQRFVGQFEFQRVLRTLDDEGMAEVELFTELENSFDLLPLGYAAGKQDEYRLPECEVIIRQSRRLYSCWPLKGA
jgi:hypothetical protein